MPWTFTDILAGLLLFGTAALVIVEYYRRDKTGHVDLLRTLVATLLFVALLLYLSTRVTPTAVEALGIKIQTTELRKATTDGEKVLAALQKESATQRAQLKELSDQLEKEKQSGRGILADLRSIQQQAAPRRLTANQRLLITRQPAVTEEAVLVAPATPLTQERVAYAKELEAALAAGGWRISKRGDDGYADSVDMAAVVTGLAIVVHGQRDSPTANQLIKALTTAGVKCSLMKTEYHPTLPLYLLVGEKASEK